KLLGNEETLDGCPDQWETVIAHGCVAVVLKSSARSFALEQRPATWIGASAICSRRGEAIGLVDHILNRLGIFRSDGGEIVFDLCGKFRHANGVVELELRIEQPFRKPYIDDRRARITHRGERRLDHPIDVRIGAEKIACYSNAGTFERVNLQLLRVGGRELAFTFLRSGVGRIYAGHRAQRDCHIVDAAGHWSPGVKCQRKWNDSASTEETVGRLQTHNAVRRRWPAD